MGDEGPKSSNALEAAAQSDKPEQNPEPATIEQARKFLQDDTVRLASRETKVEFLRSKGLQESQITKLLDEEVRDVSSATAAKTTTDTSVDSASSSPSTSNESPPEKKPDHPPILTYPEFLTSAPKPPPLVTVSGFLNTLYAFGGLSTLIYGGSKLVLAPMVDSLTEARADLRGTAAENLKKLVEKLEGSVSEIPPHSPRHPADSRGHAGAIDHDDGRSSSSYDDPTELFHRDIGVQTSLPPSPVSTSPPPDGRGSASARQAARISDVVASLRAVSSGFVAQSEEDADLQATLNQFNEDVGRLRNPPTNDFVGGYSLYGSSTRNEPDDEIKKAKENIRRVKGVLLSARSFPALAR